MDKKSETKCEKLKSFSKAFLEFLRNLTPSILFFTISVAIWKFNNFQFFTFSTNFKDWGGTLFSLFALLVSLVSLLMNTGLFIDYILYKFLQESKLIKYKNVIEILNKRKYGEISNGIKKKIKRNRYKYNSCRVIILLIIVILLGILIGLPIVHLLYLSKCK